MKRWTTLIIMLLAVSACAGGPKPGQTSMVIASGPFVLNREEAPSSIYTMLTGQKENRHHIMFLLTSFTFRKLNDESEYLLFVFLAPYRYEINKKSAERLLQPYDYHHNYASPGTYVLDDYQIGGQKFKYDAQKCGQVFITVQPNEIVYIGGLKGPSDYYDEGKNYAKIIPRFTSDGIPTYESIGVEKDIKTLQWMQGKNQVMRLPSFTMPNPPAECEGPSKNIFERINEWAQ